MIDTHIHIGQFYNVHTSPMRLMAFMDSVGVDFFAASSTTICERNFDKVLLEMKELVKIAGNRVMPTLWVAPEMIEGNIVSGFLDSGIKWRCLKIHPQLDPGLWIENDRHTNALLTLANTLHVPVLIHTGETEGCYPMEFEKIIRHNPDINFILAHGRPLGQTLELMREYPNCWTDTAFMPVDNIVKLCEEKVSDRVLWGSDFPIFQYYQPQIDGVKYYMDKMRKLKSRVSEDDFEKITDKNSKLIFKLCYA